MSDPDIIAMQREHEERLRTSHRWIIAETEHGFEVHEWTADGVAPWTVYPTPEAAAARLLQLMLIKHAIIPQAYPEDVCVGVRRAVVEEWPIKRTHRPRGKGWIG